MMRRPRSRLTAAVLVLAFATAALAGCITADDLTPASADGDADAFTTSRGWSQPLSPAEFDVLPGVKELVPSFDGTPMELGIFRPDVEGCDWERKDLPDACRLPVVLTASPYWGPATADAGIRPPLVEWLVPRGYAVVQMALRGTGDSGGCMEFGSLNEQRDVDEIITWIAEAPWSDGNVGMMGRSYVGTTPWYGAAFGNPHLKTIVPIHGITDWGTLMFKNGTSETRGPILHTYFTWAYGMGLQDGGAADRRAEHWADQLACVDTVEGAAYGPSTKALADASHPYWEERNMRARILENYNGSVWVIHGLHDWNVNPSQSQPFLQDLQDKGLEVKAWLGVWQHNYPDRRDEHENLRWDWAETVVTWFDRHLKGLDVDTGPVVEVQDSLLVWRAEASFPPRDAVFREWEIGAGGALTPRGEAERGEFVLSGSPTAAPYRATWAQYMVPGAAPVTVQPPTSEVNWRAGPQGTYAVFESAPLDAPLRVSGLPQFHVEVTPTTAVGGSLFAELVDVWPDGRTVRIGWAAIDVRNHAGGNAHADALVPGEPVIARMEFEPLDALVAEGHTLRLVVHKNGVETVDPSPTADPLALALGGERSLLRLPVIERPNLIPSYEPDRYAQP